VEAQSLSAVQYPTRTMSCDGFCSLRGASVVLPSRDRRLLQFPILGLESIVTFYAKRLSKARCTLQSIKSQR
jgi:hypothetical protein